MSQTDPYLVVFEPLRARYVRLTIASVNRGEAVALSEVQVYALDGMENLATSAAGARVTVSSTATGDPAAFRPPTSGMMAASS